MTTIEKPAPDPLTRIPDAMKFTLSAIEIRVLGSLIEKEITTPEYYPLTLNALANACNQRNNREPVLALEETTVIRAIESLREKRLVTTVTGAGIRVPKYREGFVEMFSLAPPEVAVMSTLMLRGPQTLGELRGRSAPLFAFESLDATQTTIEQLSADGRRPALVAKLPRQPGQKEIRFAHTLSGELPQTALEGTTNPEKARLVVLAENARIAALEKEVKKLHEKVDVLGKRLAEFTKQFE